jgi:hypothetical protein
MNVINTMPFRLPLTLLIVTLATISGAQEQVVNKVENAIRSAEQGLEDEATCSSKTDHRHAEVGQCSHYHETFLMWLRTVFGGGPSNFSRCCSSSACSFTFSGSLSREKSWMRSRTLALWSEANARI